MAHRPNASRDEDPTDVLGTDTAEALDVEAQPAPALTHAARRTRLAALALLLVERGHRGTPSTYVGPAMAARLGITATTPAL